MLENSATKDVDISMTNISHFAHVYDMRYVLSELENIEDEEHSIF